MPRINVDNIRGRYYNNTENIDNTDRICEMKQGLASDLHIFASTEEDSYFYSSVEENVIRYIKTLPIKDCNNLLDRRTRKIAVSEIPENILKIYSQFKASITLTLIINIYCDYFSMEYDLVIKQLPNNMKLKLYDELSTHTVNKEYLYSYLINNSNNCKRLF